RASEDYGYDTLPISLISLTSVCSVVKIATTPRFVWKSSPIFRQLRVKNKLIGGKNVMKFFKVIENM
ncbi:MAG: hypothetical protein KDK65_02560, partial [Chlamydiia bacterium]|nr:hypothetical protein [Chlamydiia bacterium]